MYQSDTLYNGSITGRIYFGNSSLGDLHGCRFNLQRWNAYRQRKSCVHQLVCAVHHVSLPFDTRFRVAEKYPRCGFSQPDIRSRNVFSLRSIRSYAIPVAVYYYVRANSLIFDEAFSTHKFVVCIGVQLLFAAAFLACAIAAKRRKRVLEQ